MDSVVKNNQVTVVGVISSEAEFNHEAYGEDFYTACLSIPRTSGYKDKIPITISDRMCKVKELQVGQPIAVYGQFRSFNRHGDDRNQLVLSVFAQEMELLNGSSKHSDENDIFLNGFICKEPVYRKTPRGREIAQLIVAVHRVHGKSDYIPCICWGRNARFASALEVGSHVKLHGRIQSREYVKRLSATETETRMAYEVSVSKIEFRGEN